MRLRNIIRNISPGQASRSVIAELRQLHRTVSSCVRQQPLLMGRPRSNSRRISIATTSQRRIHGEMPMEGNLGFGSLRHFKRISRFTSFYNSDTNSFER